MLTKEDFSMRFKHVLVPSTLALAVGLGFAQQSAASVYARSYSALSDLTVVLSDDGGVSPGGGFVRSFNFQLTNTATLSGVSAIETANCNGTVAANNCSVAAPTLDAAAANAPGSLPNRANNDFTFFGPGTDQYANADSVVYSAQLTGDPSSSTEQIAEAEIQTATAASSSAEITSTTGFTFEFTVAGADQLAITFSAIADYLAAIDDPAGANQTAQANTRLQFTLSNDANSALTGSFTPDGAGTAECAAGGGVTCTALLDEFDLNTDVGVSTDGQSSGRSTAGAGFSVVFGNLSDGDWTLTLNNLTSTLVNRNQVSAPGVLLLMGVGLAALGVTRRRSKQVG
jgi:hypothetical protein